MFYQPPAFFFHAIRQECLLWKIWATYRLVPRRQHRWSKPGKLLQWSRRVSIYCTLRLSRSSILYRINDSRKNRPRMGRAVLLFFVIFFVCSFLLSAWSTECRDFQLLCRQMHSTIHRQVVPNSALPSPTQPNPTQPNPAQKTQPKKLSPAQPSPRNVIYFSKSCFACLIFVFPDIVGKDVRFSVYFCSVNFLFRLQFLSWEFFSLPSVSWVVAE